MYKPNKAEKSVVEFKNVRETAKKISVQALEPRILLDAAAAATVADAAVDQVVNESVDNAIANLAESGLSQTSDNDSHVEAYEAYLAQSDSKQLVVIDSAVANPETLLSDIDPAAQVVFIDSDTDGVEQLADLLSSLDNLDALHIISHGEQGQLKLGSSVLNDHTMSGEYADELAVIGDALSEHGDILIYGCDFAGGEEGAEAAALLADLTGADVAASIDDTGAAVHGGDWDLESKTGHIESRVIQALNFNGILADTDGDGVDDSADIDADGDGIVDKNELPPRNGWDIVSVAGTADQVGTIDTGTSIATVTVTTPDGLFRDWDSANFGAGTSDSLVNIDETTAGNGTYTTTFSEGLEGFELFLNNWGASADGSEVVLLGNFTLTLDDGTVINNAGFTIDSRRGNFPVFGSDNELLIKTTVGGIDYVQDPVANGNGFQAYGTIIFDDLLKPNGEFDITKRVTSISFDKLGDAIGPSGYFAVSMQPFQDTDSDGAVDHYDLDSDNDGISDIYESGSAIGIQADTDGDGVVSVAEAEVILGAGNADADSDGLLDIFDADITDATSAASVGTIPVDIDGDGVQDFYDLDSDNDGIPDAVEAQPTAGYVGNDGNVLDDDADGDGIIDIYDGNDGTTGFHGGDATSLNSPEDTDGDGTPDYIDQDSDGDGAPDSTESSLPLTGVDANGDGIDDGVNASYTDPDGDVNAPISDLENATDNDPADADYRSVNDKDGDGVPDYADLDQDGDGILDADEGRGGNHVPLTTAGNGTTASGTVVTSNLASTGFTLQDTSHPVNPVGGIFDNSNFTFLDPTVTALDSLRLIGNIASFNDVPLEFDFAGTAVTEVYLHVASVDALELEFLQANNPGVGFQILSGVNFQNGATNPGDLLFQDTDPISADASAADEMADGAVGGGSADATIRFFSTNGGPLTQLNFLMSKSSVPGVGDGEGWHLALEVNSDTDGDGIPDHCDLDSDNDGISDLEESGNADALAADTDGDGVVSPTEAVAAGFTDTDGDGVYDQLGTPPADTDGDGIADYLDLDSDNDGIPDVVEGQPTNGYIPPSGMDSDGDGVDDAWDTTTGHGGDFVGTEDTDGDGTPDYIDEDSDGDGAPDSSESSLPLTGVDANGDGIDDGVNASYADTDGDVNAPISDLENATDNDPSDVDYRSVNDKDGDGVPDHADLDQDGDGILDADEGLEGNHVALTTAGNGTTASGTVVTSNLASTGFTLQDTSHPVNPVGGIFDNPNFTFLDPTITALDSLRLIGNIASFNDVPLEFDFAGTAVTEVYFHVASVDALELEFLQASNPGVGFQILSGVNFQNGATNPGDLLFQDTDPISADASAADEMADGTAGGGSADATIRFFSTNGGPLTQLNFLMNKSSVPGVGDGDGWHLALEVNRDTDGDGIPDHCDLDSDNDGISDLEESGNADALAADTDGDGVVTPTEAAAAGFTDTDGDGVYDQLGTPPADTDGDGIADYLDLDSDNDGIPDVVEGQPTNGYIPPSGMDSDGDGVDDAWDTTTGHGGDFVGTEDTDGDGTPDYIDEDSDGDGAPDSSESSLPLTGVDANGDGIDDGVNASYTDPDGDVNAPISDLENATDNDPSDVDYRSVNDKDGDGVPDHADQDQDGDGILDVDEGLGNPVALTTAGNGTTASGTVVTSNLASTGLTLQDTSHPVNPVGGIFDNSNFTFLDPTVTALDSLRIIGNIASFNDEPLEFDFAGTAVTEVYFHVASLDALELEFLQASNPGVGFQILSGVNFQNGATNPGDLLFQDTDPISADGSAADEAADGTAGGGSADATIRFFSTNGGPLTQLNFLMSKSSVPNVGDGDGWHLALEVNRDTDGDGIPDHCDLDSDNDGISDLEESGNADALAADTDGDGVVTPTEAVAAGFTDTDGDGVYDQLGTPPADTDGDGIADYLDLDSDNDGIPDVIEGQPTNGYIPPSGMDSDGDGVDDAWDTTPGHGGDFVGTEDTDGDGTPDYIDQDSDGDGVPDITESGLPLTGTDADGDGIDDGVNASYTDTDGDVNTPISDLMNADSDATDADYRSINLDPMNDVYVTNEDTPVSLDPLANDDSDIGIVSMEIQNVPNAATEGSLTYIDAATGATVTVAPGAVLTPAEAATLVFTPVADFAGPVPPIGYLVTDEDGQTDTAQIDITVTPTPDAVDDPFVTPEDTPVNVSPLGNDDGGAGIDTVTVDSIPDPATEGELTYTDAAGNTVVVTPGTVLTPAEAATLTFTPVMDFNGTVPPIDYTITDVNGATSEADILIEIIPTPDAVDDPFVTPEDTPVNVSPLGNDDGGAGIDTVTVDSIPDPATEGELTYTDAAGNTVVVTPGTVLTPAEAATLTFTPVMDFNGTVPPIDYTLTDVNGATSEADILIEIIPTPDAVDDPFVTPEDTPVNVSPLGNDDGGAGIDTVTVDSIPDPATEGELTYTDAAGNTVVVTPGTVLTPAEAATLTFTPVMDFNGTVPPIDYTITDVNGATSEADILIEIIPTPDAVDDPFVTPEDTPVNVSPLGNDDGGAGIDTVTVDSIPDPATEGELTYTDAAGNTVVVTPGTVLTPAEAATLTFTPVMDFNGTVPPIDYTITDVNGATSEADILIEIIPTPDAVDDPFVTPEDTPVNVSPLGNDDGGAGIDTVTVDSIPDPATEGELTYTDAAGNTVVVTPGTVLTPAEAATLTFTPVMDFNGTVPPIDYTLTDVNGATSEADILIEIIPTPDAVDDPFVTNEDTPVNVSPLGNDDGGAGIDTVTVDSIPDPATEGELTYTDAAGNTVVVTPGTVLTPAEAATLTFTPVMDFNGTVPPIDYTITDVNGATSEADILIEIIPTPDAVDDPFVTPEDTPVNVSPLGNDDGGAGIDTVTVDSIPDPAIEGELTYIDAAGNTVVVAPGDVLTPAEAATLTFNPVMDFNGTVPPIDYTITDVNGATSEADILIEIIPTPDAVDDPFVTNEDTPVNVSPLGNDDGGAGIDTVTVDSIPDPATEGELTYTDAAGNTVVVTPGTVLTPAEAATLTFTPVMDFNGTVPPIDYTLTDVNGATSEADILIEIIPTPDAVDDPFVTPEDTPVNVSPLGNDDGGAGIDTVTVDSIPDPATEGELTYTDAAGNTVVVTPGTVLTPAEAATLTFTPVMDFNGTVPPIDYTITDVNGETSEADILIEIIPTPDAVDDPFVTLEDTPVNVSPLGNDDGGAGIDTVTVDSIPDPAIEGELTYIDAAGNTVVVAPGDVLTPAEAATLTFNPVMDFNGTVPPIDYTITDINGATSEADILIEIIPTPDAVDDPFVTNEDTPVNVSPLGNDDGGAGIDTVTVDSIPDPATEGELTYTDAAGNTVVVTPGTVLTPAEAATLTFTPVMDFNGTVPPIDYTLTDVNGATSEADILIEIIPTPDAVDDPFVAPEDTPVNVSPLGNDDGGAGIDTVTVDSIPDPATEGELTYTDAAGNTVVVTPGTVLTPAEAATLTFTPVMDFNGTVPPIDYTITDVNGETSEADILIEIIPTPDAVDDPFVTLEDTPVNVSPLGNDDGGAGIDTVTVDSIPDPATEGELTYIDAAGNTVVVAPGDVLTPAEAATLTFNPVMDFNGTVPPINYTLTDVNGATSEADILIEIVPTPDAVDDPFVTNEDTPVNVSPLGNDDGGAGIDSVTVDSIPDPATEGELTYTDAAGNTVVVTPGTVLTPAEAATLTFTPVMDFNGTVPPINYTLTDVNGATSEADILIEIIPTPDAVDDPFVTPEDTPVNVSPLGNDDGGAGIDTVTVDSIPDPATEGELTYTDAAGNTVVVTPGTVLTPAEAATLTFTPVMDFNGTVPPIDYTITDVNGETSEADILIEIIPTPDAVDDPFVTLEDTPVNVSPLGNDDGGAGIDSVTVDSIPDPATEGELTYIDATGNTVVVTPGTVLTPAEAVTLTFTPVMDFNGTVPPINYTLTDVNGATSEADILIEITPTPDAVDDPFVAPEDTPVNVSPLGNDDVGAGIDSVTVDSIPDPATEGELTYIDAAGNTVVVAPGDVLTPAEAATLTFNPVMDFNGTVPPINYTITDVNGETSEADILIEIVPTPDAVDDPFVAIEDTPINVSPLGNDDGGAGIDSVTVDSIPDPATEGELTYVDASGNTVVVTPGTVLTPAEAATLTFTPVMDFSGTVPPINYTLTDVNGATSEADILIEVMPTPDAFEDNFATDPSTPVLLDPLSNDDLADGADFVTVNNIPDPATVGELTYLDAAGNPVVVMAGDVLTPAQVATLTFVPVDGFTGSVPPINYTVTDVNGVESSADINVIVGNAPPLAVDETVGTQPDTPVVIDPLANDSDPNGDPLMITEINGVALTPGIAQTISVPNGTVTVAADGTITVTPDAGFAGDVNVPYTITDSDGATSSAAHTVEVPNAPPVAVDETVVAAPGMSLVIDPLTNDDDPNGDPLMITEINGVALTPGIPQTIIVPNGTVTVAADGTITVTPDEGFEGDVNIPYTITDPDGQTSSAVHTVEVPAEPGLAALIPEVPVAFFTDPEPEIELRRTAILSEGFINAEGIVGNTVNELSSLSGIDNELLLGAALPDPTDDLVLFGHETQISEGFSSGKGYRGTHSVDPTDECGRVFVDTISEAGGLSITARSTIDPSLSAGVTGFTVTLANGEPLPEWISEIGDGEFLLERSVGIEAVALKIVSHRDGASDLVRHVEIDTLTGQIREQQQAGTFGSSFYETIDTAVIDE